MIGGIVHETAIPVVVATNPEAIAVYEITALAIGAKTNGINKEKFITIGNPNIAGSLILKIPGVNVKGAIILLIWLALLRLATIAITITNPNVAPPPPIYTKFSSKGLD